jgi:hypothetical protein
MQFYNESDIINFFDVSIVMPFYKKLKEFKIVLPANQKFFQRNGIELILVLDEPDEENELISFINNYPFINWKIILNRETHEWRNPSKALNVGIKHASHKYVLVMSPETQLFTDLIYRMRYILQYYKQSFAIGMITFANLSTVITSENILNNQLLPYGSIMVEKQHLEAIRGYTEEYSKWGGDDNNIRARLEMSGIRKMIIPQAIAIHREENSDGHSGRSKKSENIPIELLKDVFYPKKMIVNDESWGSDFNEICFNWKKKKTTLPLCQAFIEKFKQNWVKNESIFNKQFKVIALIQVRNEKHYLPELFLNLDKFCDGIILLDDESTDGSFEAAMSDKLLLKVQIKNKGFFDDLGNRNILLQLAHFFSSEWFFYMDADERFDTRYLDLYSITNNNDVDTVCFWVVHLWDNENYYRKDLPENKSGLLLRYRMFRNKGFMQINSNRTLHFPVIPYKHNRHNANILIKHFGHIDRKNRERKYEKYMLEDEDGEKQGYKYDYLLDNDVELEKVENIRL